MPLNTSKLIAGGEVYSYGNQSPAVDAVPLQWNLPAFRYNADPAGLIDPTVAGIYGWQLSTPGTPGVWVPVSFTAKAPFRLQLGYGPDDFGGALPALPEGIPKFWLHPFTSLSNVSAVGEGTDDDHAIIEWEVGKVFTPGQVTLDCFVRQLNLTAGVGTTDFEAVITRNGLDFGPPLILGDSTGSTVDTRRTQAVLGNWVDGDTMGLKLQAGANYSSGFLIAQFTLTLESP
jgi:hypothetical protein